MNAVNQRMKAHFRTLRERRSAQVENSGAKREKDSPKKIMILFVIRCVIAIAAVLLCAFAEFKPFIEVLICIVSAVIAGYNVLYKAWQRILDGEYFSRYVLIVLVDIIAFSVGASAEAVLSILFYSAWETVCSYIENDGRGTIRRGMMNTPESTTILLGGIPHKVSADKVKIGTLIYLHPGERTATDCVVVSGNGFVLPYGCENASDVVKVSVGSEIVGGSLVLEEALTVRSLSSSSDALPVVITEVLEKCAAQKTGYEKRLDASAKTFAAVGIVLSLIVGLLVPLIFRAPFADCLKRAGVILLVTCPYVFLAALPYTVFAGLSGIAKRGALVTNTEKLSSLASVTTVAGDLRAAFSDGIFRLEEVVSDNMERDNLLRLAACAAYGSDIPQLMNISENTEFDKNVVIKREHFPEIGVSATLAGNVIVSVGFCGLMRELGIQDERICDDGLTVYVAVDDKLAGILRFSVAFSTDAPKIFDHLKHIGINRTVLLTDEPAAETRKSAEWLGVQEFYPECTPGKKGERISGLQAMQIHGERLAYLGTGLGDRNVMQEADVSFMPYSRKNKDAVADVLLLNNKPETPGNAIAAAYDTVDTLRRHYLAAMIVKILLVILAACGWISFWIPPIADMILHFAALMGAMRVYDPVHFDPNLKRRALRTTKKLFDFRGSMLQSAGGEVLDDPDELRRHRAERKALLYKPKNK